MRRRSPAVSPLFQQPHLWNELTRLQSHFGEESDRAQECSRRNRKFDRSRYEPGLVVERLSDVSSEPKSVSEITEICRKTVGSSLQPEAADIWLNAPPDPMATWPVIETTAGLTG